MKPAGRVLRLASRAFPPLLFACATAALLSGFYSDLLAVGPWHVALLAALLLASALRGWQRMQADARGEPGSARIDLELGALLLVAGFAIAEPLGGIDSPAFPVVYLLIAFLAIVLPVKVAAALAIVAVALDVARFAVAGALPARWPELAAQVFFLVAFAGLCRAILVAQDLEGRAAGLLAARARQRQMEERARQYRLGLHADVDPRVDDAQWLTAAVKEVEDAVGNALEVAEVALRSHTIAVFLLSVDERQFTLHDCRSLSDEVRREPFEASEGILGAVIKRRMPMRLCGELKGVTWYNGRPEVRSVLAVPLIDRRGAGIAGNAEGFVCGMIVADRLEATPFTEEDERLLVATSREVLRAIEIERVMGWIRRSREETEQVFAAIQELNRCTKMDEVLEATLRLVGKVGPLDLVAFTRRFEQEGRLYHRVERVTGLEKFAALEGLVFPENGGLVASAIRFGSTLPGRDLKANETPQIFDPNTVVRGLLTLKVVPVRAGNTPIGTLVCGSRRRRALDADAVRRLEVIAMQAGEAFLRAKLFSQTERMATTDGLTGLLNHRAFQAKFDEELARAARTGRKVTLILTDIDHFKSINDTYGHATGDAVLRGVARILERCARSTDVVARYGGEEFAIVLPETDMKGGKNIAERIREAVMAHEFSSDLGPLRCTLSLGIATWPDVATVKEELFEKADQCLYHCKRMGRNRSTTVEEMKRELAEAHAA